MKKFYSLILMTAFILLSAGNAKAQNGVWTNSITQAFQKDWANDAVPFSLTEVALYFETDTMTLSKAINAFVESDRATYMVDDNSDKELYFTTEVDGVVYPNVEQTYSADYNGFWMNVQGKPLNYAAEGYAWYAMPYADSNEDLFAVLVGQRPNLFPEGASLSTCLKMHYKGKTAEFNVGVTVEPKPEVTITTNLSELKIQKDYEMTLEFIEGKENEGKSFTLEMPDIYDVLGTTSADFDAVAGEQTYTQVLVADNSSGETIYSWSDKLELPSDASGGAWYGRYYQYNEATGSETLIEMNAPQTWGSTNTSGAATNTYYLQNISLADGVFTIGSSGQFKNVMKVGDTDWTYLYIINEDKAARVKVSVNIVPQEVINPDEFVLVGETTIEISADIDDNYATTSFTIDMEPILAALEAEASDIADVYAWASEGVMSDNHTEREGGYYFNEEGFIADWGSNSSHFIAPDGSKSDALANGTWKIGQMQGHFTNITETTTVPSDLIFQVGQNYYVVHVLYTVIYNDEPDPEDPDPEKRFDIVFTQPMSMEIVPSANYYVGEPSDVQEKMCTQLDLDAITSLIGEGKYEFYGLIAPADADSYPTLTKSTGYTPNTGFSGGFWMGKPVADLGEEYVTTSWVKGWGDNSFGIEWNLSTGIIGLDQYPGVNSVGASYNSTFYLVNTENNKAIKYIITVTYVSEYTAKGEVVGSGEIVGVLSDDDQSGDGYYYVGSDISTTEVFTTLEIDPSEIADCTWMITNQTGNLVAAPSTLEGENITLDINGRYLDTLTNPDLLSDVIFTVAFDEDTNRFYYSMWTDPEPGAIYSTVVGLMKDGKIYTFKISGGDEETITGISNVEASKAVDGKIYDLSGRRIDVPAKGMYIKNSKKYIVK